MVLEELKGQSAIEYLTTYGWMLLAVAIIGGTIFTAVQNSSQIQSVKGFTNADVRVENFGATNNGLKAEIRGAASETIVDANVSIIDEETGITVDASKEKTIPVGEVETLTFENFSNSETINTYKVRVRYDSGALKNLTSAGTLTGRIETKRNNKTDGTTFDLTALIVSNTTSVNTSEDIEFNASSSKPRDKISSYNWDWTDDGNYEATSKVLVHKYNNSGTKTVRLKVEDSDGNSDTTTETIEVNSYPTASFIANTTSLTKNEVLNVNATDSSGPDGSISSYEWDWTNDGVYEETGNIQEHSYSNTGNYTVVLKLTGEKGLTNTTTKEIEVTTSTTTPTVETLQTTNINSENTTLNGNITDTGGKTPEVRFKYGKDQATLSNTTEIGTSSGEFSKTITGLNPRTTYYFKAEGNNSAGKNTGEILNFTTKNQIDIIDSFDDGNINEYSDGAQNRFNTQESVVYEGSHSLEGTNSGTTSSIGSMPGNGLEDYIQPGDNFQFYAYPGSGGAKMHMTFEYSGDAGTMPSNLAVRLEVPSNTFSLRNGNSGISTKSVSLESNKWYLVKVETKTNGNVTSYLKETDGTQIATVSAKEEFTKSDTGIAWVVRDSSGTTTSYYDQLEITN